MRPIGERMRLLTNWKFLVLTSILIIHIQFKSKYEHTKKWVYLMIF